VENQIPQSEVNIGFAMFNGFEIRTVYLMRVIVEYGQEFLSSGRISFSTGEKVKVKR